MRMMKTWWRGRALGLWVTAAASGCRGRTALDRDQMAPASRSSGSSISSRPAESPFAPTIENNLAPQRRPPGSGMVWIPGGEFSMGAAPVHDLDGEGPGCGDPLADAEPVHRVYVDGFWIDRTEVTNEEFTRFVRATG